MTRKQFFKLLAFTGTAVLSSTLSCHSYCDDFCDELGPAVDPCGVGVVLHWAASGAYRTLGAAVSQDTCSSGLTAGDLQRYQADVVNDGNGSLIISRATDTPPELFYGPVRCNKATATMPSVPLKTASCQYERARAGTLTITANNTIDVQLSETWHNVSGTGCSGSEGCVVSYQMTLSL